MRHALLVLLAWLPLVVPAAADTPPAPYRPSGLAADVMAGLPGAPEAYQLETAMRDVINACRAYYDLHGGVPGSVIDLLNWGLLPFEAIGPVGQRGPWVAVDPDGLPAPGAIGVDFRAEDIRLVMMGAEGDPLTPIVKMRPYGDEGIVGVGSTLNHAGWRRVVLRDGLQTRLQAYHRCHGMAPSSLMAACEFLGWRPLNHELRDPGSAVGPAPGALVELAPGGMARYTLTGDPAACPSHAPLAPGIRSGRRFSNPIGSRYNLLRPGQEDLLAGLPAMGTVPLFQPLGSAALLPPLPPAGAPILPCQPSAPKPEVSDKLAMLGPILVHDQFATLIQLRRPQATTSDDLAELVPLLLEVPRGNDGAPLPVHPWQEGGR
ncbi:MAG TPA: hypothetical protein VEI97_13320 [bacterium]|nr:hypothetical protein [bacterium]